MYSVALGGERIGRADARRVLDLARSYMPSKPQLPRVAAAGDLPPALFGEEAQWEAYGTASGQWWNYDPLTQGSSPALSAGLSRGLAGAWRIAIGLSAERANEDTVFNGRYDTDGEGGHLFVTWNAGNPGWRLFALANYLGLDATIRRGYVNGSTTATSSGSTSGHTYGALVRGEYAIALNDRFDLVPHADYHWTHTRLGAYTEDPASGPFPASFQQQTHDSGIGRVGLEAGYRPDRNTRLFGWLAYAERLSGETASIAGEFLGVGAFSLQNLRVPQQSWIDAGVGFTTQLTPRVRLTGNVGLLNETSSSKQSSVFASLGVALGF